MKDTKKILRTAIYNAISGSITYSSVSVPVYDERVPNGATPSMYIILSTQQETDAEPNDSVWITDSSIDIEIYNKTPSEASKDVVDSIYESMMEIIMPTTQTIGITVPAGFEFRNAKRGSCVTQSIVDTPTESVIISRVRLTFQIVQK